MDVETLDIIRGMPMIIYYAGNFPQMKKPEQERKTKELVHKHGIPIYRRLISFHFRPDIENVLDIRREEDETQS